MKRKMFSTNILLSAYGFPAYLSLIGRNFWKKDIWHPISLIVSIQ